MAGTPGASGLRWLELTANAASLPDCTSGMTVEAGSSPSCTWLPSRAFTTAGPPL